jgi:hypothetical protein
LPKTISVWADTPVNVSGSPTTITLNTTAGTMASSYYFEVTIDGETSTGVGTLTVGASVSLVPTAEKWG